MKIPLFNLHDVIVLLTVAVALLLAVFQWLLSKQKAHVSNLLSLFFLSVSLGALGRLLLWNDYIDLNDSLLPYVLPYLLGLEQLGKGVLLYLYVLAVTRDTQFSPKHYVIHALPLAVYCLVIAVDGIRSDQMRFLVPIHSVTILAHIGWLWNFLKVIPVLYGLAAVVVMFKYQRQLKNYYSSVSVQGPLWLNLLVLGFAINWVWSLIVHVIGQFISTTVADTFGILDNYLTFFLVNALFVYSLAYAHQLLTTTQQHTNEPSTPDADAPAPEVIEKIRQGMEQQQLYLTTNLNIEEFARQIGVPYREVSNIINKQFNTNFFEFVNQYRVEKAKHMLLDPAFANTTILDILLECGFNSKSSFRRFFKRYTGMPAADFRKLHGAAQAPSKD